MSHPNALAVNSVGEMSNGVPYFVMQYVNGRSSAERVETDGPFDIDVAKRILGEVASALAAAHRQGIIHRDIKPANILHDDESGRVLVSDFGIASVRVAREEPGDSTMKLTRTGTFVGTPAYTSPEQILGEPLDDKTDIYALGLLGYELLTGRGPYDITSPGEIIAAHLRDRPRKLSSLRPEVDPELESLLESCLSKDPADRPSAADIAKRLTHGASVLLEWPPPGLERLQGALAPTTRMIGMGSLALGLPLIAMSVFERGSRWRELLPPVPMLASIAAVGTLLLLVGVARLFRLARNAVRATRSGTAPSRSPNRAPTAGRYRRTDGGRARIRWWNRASGAGCGPCGWSQAGCSSSPHSVRSSGFLRGCWWLRVGTRRCSSLCSRFASAGLLGGGSRPRLGRGPSPSRSAQSPSSVDSDSTRSESLRQQRATFEQVRRGQALGAGWGGRRQRGWSALAAHSRWRSSCRCCSRTCSAKPA